jgi:hypothetical protein
MVGVAAEPIADRAPPQATPFQTRTYLCRKSNRSLSVPPIPAGKRFGEARDRAGIFGEDRLFRATETGISRVSRVKAPGS